jgi:excisionase family DNA binding protein
MTKTTTYTTLSGFTIEHPIPTRAVASFLDNVRDAADDPAVGVDSLIALIYGQSNPLLDRSTFASVGAVTPAVFANPLYHVLLDRLGRKRVQLGLLDLAATEARYTLTPEEAADRIGVSVSAVRQAIERHKLPAWKRGGRIFLDPVSVDSYKVSNRGPRAS